MINLMSLEGLSITCRACCKRVITKRSARNDDDYSSGECSECGYQLIDYINNYLYLDEIYDSSNQFTYLIYKDNVYTLVYGGKQIATFSYEFNDNDMQASLDELIEICKGYILFV